MSPNQKNSYKASKQFIVKLGLASLSVQEYYQYILKHLFTYHANKLNRLLSYDLHYI